MSETKANQGTIQERFVTPEGSKNRAVAIFAVQCYACGGRAVTSGGRNAKTLCVRCARLHRARNKGRMVDGGTMESDAGRKPEGMIADGQSRNYLENGVLSSRQARATFAGIAYTKDPCRPGFHSTGGPAAWGLRLCPTCGRAIGQAPVEAPR